MRLAKALVCAAALFALLAPGVRADDYNKLTYFTFSAPVQVPGATLPAGTYMFKLADPASGRRAIQIWDQEGKKLHTTLLTMSVQRMEIPKEPMVMFSEAPSGEAPAARSWFYEAERSGYEFVYPKDQAMKIAKASHDAVLATEESSAELGALNAAKIGRVDETGQFADANASTSRATAAADPSPSATATDTSTATAATDTSAAAAPASTAAASAPEPSANRTEPAASVARTDAATPVGTSGSSSATAAARTSSQQAGAAASSVTAPQSATTAPASSTDRPADAAQLPRTASPLALLQLLSVGSLLSAIGVRRLRRRLAESR